MIRTQIQLPEEEHRRLKRAAAEQGRSMADCIREGIAIFLGRAGQSERRILQIAGAFSPIEMDDLKAHDRWWSEAALEASRPRARSKRQRGQGKARRRAKNT